jgi:hypothetical protein
MQLGVGDGLQGSLHPSRYNFMIHKVTTVIQIHASGFPALTTPMPTELSYCTSEHHIPLL